LHAKWGERVDFRIVYIREAHPLDGDAPPREPDAPQILQPRTSAARHEVAAACVAGLGLEAIPAWVDDMDDAVSRAYAAQPDRLYLIGADGKVAWKCGKGPQAFDPEGLEAAIREALGVVEPPPTMEE
jgi:hypothetical protein